MVIPYSLIHSFPAESSQVFSNTSMQINVHGTMSQEQRQKETGKARRKEENKNKGIKNICHFPWYTSSHLVQYQVINFSSDHSPHEPL